MKNYFFTFMMASILIVPSLAQDNSQQKLLYQHKIKSFTKLQNSGQVMLASGIGVGVVGAVLVATLPSGYWNGEDDSYYDSEDYNSNDDIKAFSGILCIEIGVGLLAGGITMASIGSHKLKSYKQRLNNLSLGVTRQGVTLAYRF